MSNTDLDILRFIEEAPWLVEGRTAAQLIWAVPITLESFLRGYKFHRLWYRTMDAFRDCWIVPRGDGSDERVSILPEEILRMIEFHVKGDAREAAAEEASMFINHVSESPMPTQAEILRNLQSQLQEPLELLDEDNLSKQKIQRYMAHMFTLTISPGLSMTYYETEYTRLTHVLLCIPWTLTEVSRCEGELLLEEQGDIKTRSRNMATHIANGVMDRQGWKTASDQNIAIVDPDYVTLSMDKVLRINLAIAEMELEVMKDFELLRPRPPGHSEGQEMVQSNELFRLAANHCYLPDDEAREINREHFGDDSDTENRELELGDENYFSDDSLGPEYSERMRKQHQASYRKILDIRPQPWPFKIDERYGKLWQPRLLLKHSSELNAWEREPEPQPEPRQQQEPMPQQEPVELDAGPVYFPYVAAPPRDQDTPKPFLTEEHKQRLAILLTPFLKRVKVIILALGTCCYAFMATLTLCSDHLAIATFLTVWYIHSIRLICNGSRAGFMGIVGLVVCGLLASKYETVALLLGLVIPRM